MADQPTRNGADGRPPVGDRSAGGTPAAPLTVAELLARQGGDVPRRRAGRRESAATGRQQPVPGTEPVRPPDDVRRDPVPVPPLLPTGWQPAMPAEAPVRPTPAPPPARPTPPQLPPRPTVRAVPVETPPTPPAPTPPPTPMAPPVPGLPAATPTPRPMPRVVPPAAVTPAPPLPARTPAPPVPVLPGAPAPPYQSAPVPGVRRSLPLPPIPGRDLPAPADAPPVRAPLSPRQRRLRRVAMALVALLALVAAFYVGLYFAVDRSMDRVDALVTDGPEVLAPQLQTSAQTYLVVGTGAPGRSGTAAVSTLLVHVPADGQDAVLVTVPPTALADTPTCRDADGDVRAAVTEPFAAALLDGGPSCLVRSVQQLTGLRVDHYLALDLGRLPAMVDALGDVPVCLPEPSDAVGAELDLPAGPAVLTGDRAAAYLRPSGLGDVTGADAARREQLVLTSTLRTALAGGTLADPVTLTRFLARVGDAFTVDDGSTLGDVRALGAALDALPADAVERTEVPVARVGYVPAGSDQAAVVLDATATRELFDAVIDPRRAPADAVAGTPAAPDPAAPSGAAADQLSDPALTGPVPEGTTVTVAPAGVTLDVLDATGGGRTAEVADGLAAAGFRIAARGAEPAAVDRTVVRYGPAALEPARTVAAAVPGAVLQETDAVGGAVQLVVGPDYTGLDPVAIGTPVPTSAAPPPVETGTGAGASCS